MPERRAEAPVLEGSDAMTDKPSIHVTMHLSLQGEWSHDDFHGRVEAFMEQMLLIEEADDQISDSSHAGDSGKSEVTVEQLV